MWLPEWVYTIDVLFVVGVVLFGFGGFRRGLSGELARVLALAGLVAAFLFFYPQWTASLAAERDQLPVWAVHAVVAVVMVLGSLLLFLLLQGILKLILKHSLGETTDKLTGLLAGLLRGIVSGLLLFTVLSLHEPVHQTLSGKSAIGAWVCEAITPTVQEWLVDRPLLPAHEEVPPHDPAR